MHKNSILLLLLCICFSAAGQEKIYYDEGWQKTKRKKAKWYRLYTMQGELYKIEDHYIDGPLYMTGFRTDIESNSCKYREGPIVFYDREGHKLREGQYKEGSRTGVWKHYFKGSDVVRREMHYLDQYSEAATTLIFDSATHKLKHKWIRDAQNKSKNWDYTDNDSIFSETTVVDSGSMRTTTTRYPDRTVLKKSSKHDNVTRCYNKKGDEIPCTAAADTVAYIHKHPKFKIDVYMYLRENLRYPAFAMASKIAGRVLVKFFVDEDGAVADVKVLQHVGGGCDEEAVRVVSEMPYWQPGYLNGEAARVYVTLPIQFSLR